MPIKEILNLNRKSTMVRIPQSWIRENFPPGEGHVQVFRDIDGDKIIISPLKREQTNVSTNRKNTNS